MTQISAKTAPWRFFNIMMLILSLFRASVRKNEVATLTPQSLQDYNRPRTDSKTCLLNRPFND